ncbi:MAG: hypothetical protein LBP27_07060 [Treponema sp.]|jgi:hypothetical protein|nr:hypothetical protein [Treponema sp.]
MEITVSKTRTFVPEWNGNKKLPEDEQIVVTYPALNISLRKQIIGRNTIRFEYDKDGNPTGGSGEMSLFDKEAAIRKIKPVITNLKIDGKQVISAEDLLAAPVELYGLVEEIGSHFQDEFKKESPEKN